MFKRKSCQAAIMALILVGFLRMEAVLGGGGGKKPPPDPIDAALTYVRGDNHYGDLWVSNADGSETVQILPFRAKDPCFSPDGSRIAFMGKAKPNSTPKLYIVHVDGTELTELCTLHSTYFWALGLDWSPDGSKIAFADRFNNREDIFTVRPDGTDLTNITNTTYWYEYYPRWSPTGDRLVVARSGDSDEDWPLNFAVLHLDASGQVAYAEDITDISGSPLQDRADFSAAWARTGDFIAATIQVDEYGGQRDIWLIDLADPLNPLQLTDTTGVDERHPAFDMYDLRIFYQRAGPTWRICVMNIDGSGQSIFLADDSEALTCPCHIR